MSSTPDSDDRNVRWVELTHQRQQLLMAIATVNGHSDFERPELRDEVKASSRVEEVVDDKARVLKSLNSTSLLNRLVEVGFLSKTFQGGSSPIVLFLDYDEDRDDHEVAPFGDLSRFHDLVFQILDLYGLSEAALGDVDMTDFNAVIRAVNQAVGKTVLVIVSEPSTYRFADDDAYETVAEKVEEAREDK